MTTAQALLTIQDLSIGFPTAENAHTYLKAVQSLNLELIQGHILGLVGESGCGKSLTSLSVLRLVPAPGKILSGSILFQGINLLDLSEKEMRRHRGSDIAMIPQDPLTALNPVYTIGDQIIEVIRQHHAISYKEAAARTVELLDQVQIPNAKERLKDYPHQFSGGMRQRVMIAMALSCAPKLLIADEPTTALDVTVQAQILKLLEDIRKEHGTSILMITHDLGVVAQLCDDVAVMYAGQVIEQGPVHDLFETPRHPYTQGLLHSLPGTHSAQERKRLEPILGQPPSLSEIPEGCAFEPRCSQRLEMCQHQFPRTVPLKPDHWTKCFLYNDTSA
jgi:oligopeptide transport system ATP-binding protein